MAKAGLVLLDTTVLIDVLRGVQAAARWLDDLEDVPLCSEISRVEVMRGLRTHERRAAELLFGGLGWVVPHEPITRLAGEIGRQYRRSHGGIGLADLIVAATALHVGAEVATHNVRHFPVFKGLRPPY